MGVEIEAAGCRGGFQISSPGGLARGMAACGTSASSAVAHGPCGSEAGTATGIVQAGLQAMAAQAIASWHSLAQQVITGRAAATTD